MLKTLRITSIIAAVLAVGLLAFPVVFGFRSDQDIEKFLASPSVIDKFRQERGGKPEKGEGQTSPLVDQAQAYALYLNPPPPKVVATKTPPPPPSSRPKEPLPPPAPPPGPVTSKPKFTVVLTSFYEARPEMSLALIDAPGKGRHWVREGAMVEHVTVERIKDGVVIARGGQETYEVAVPMKEQTSLVVGSAPVSATVGGPTIAEPAAVSDSTEIPAPTLAQPDITVSKAPAVSDAETAALAALVDRLKAAQSGTAEGEAASSQDPDAHAALMEQFISALSSRRSEAENVDSADEGQQDRTPVGEPVTEPEGARIGPKEAERLGDLGRELKDVRQDPNRAKLRREQLMKERRDRMKRRTEERMKRVKDLAEQSRPAE